jgi:hypothetical protein
MDTLDSPMNKRTYTNLQHPLLIIVRGLPGSGKSYLAARLHKAFGEDAVVALDPDTIDLNSQEYRDHSAALTAEGVDAMVHPYRFSLGKALQGITDHKIIIWNQPFTAPRTEPWPGELLTTPALLARAIALWPYVAMMR